MFSRKIKIWWIKRKLRLKREQQIFTIPDLINLELENHKQYLSHDRHKDKDKALYWKGKRDGISDIWKLKVK